MENNDENNNEQLDFDAVPSLSEMKQKRYEQNGGDPMHELESHSNTSNNSGSKNSDYNDLTNLHRMRIKNNVKRDNINYQSSETYSERENKGIIIRVILIILSICITGAIIKYIMVREIVEREYTPILNRVDRNAIERSKTDEQKAAEEEMLRKSEDLLKNYMDSMDDDENEVDDFNYNFSHYDGRTNATGAEVNKILEDVNVRNILESEEKEIGVSINANDVTGTNYTGVAKRKEDLDFISSKLIDSNRTYTIKCKYNEQGYIYEIDIEENEKN